MKKIALVMDGWKRYFTYAWPSGILQRIKETGEDVNLYIFNSSGDWSMDSDYNIGEYNIYNLPDFKDFDGIILDINNIRYAEVGENVIKAVKESGKPAISIANIIDDFYYVGIDNYAAMQEMIAHLHEQHGCKRFWFIMGPEDNYENNIRAQALKDYMFVHQIPYEEADFFYDSYEFQCGYQGFQQMLNMHDEIPDAIICASDNIAVGVCEAATERGYRIPVDFSVTGFDNFDKAAFFTPQISTVEHIREEVGYCCADVLIRLWAGEHVPRFSHTKAECIFGESCGCQSKLEIDIRKHIKSRIMYEIETTDFEEQVVALEYELLNCKSVREMSNLIPKCIPSMRCDAMYLVLDDHMNDFRRQADYYNQRLIHDESFHIYGYPERMNIEFCYENGKSGNCEGKSIESLFPTFEYETGGTDFLFMPLHFRNKTVGFFVIRNAVYLMEKQYLFKVMTILTSAMENLHEKEKLEYMNQVLADMSIKDSMTGLYNRLGYQQLACRRFEEHKRAKKDLMIMFVDMDRLKMINDQYGHEYGDISIKIIARAIYKCYNDDSIPIRMGGDEFLILCDMMSEEELESRVKQLRNAVDMEAHVRRLPFELTISVGCIKTDMNSDKALDNYVREADEIMYIEKKQKKANRT